MSSKTVSTKKAKYIILMAAGLILFSVGLYVWSGYMEILPHLSIVIGAGVFGYSTGVLTNLRFIDKYPEEEKRIEIEEKKDIKKIFISEGE